MRILVLGGSGYVGRSLMPLLVKSGYAVRSLIRDPGKINIAQIEIVKGDASDKEIVKKAVKGCEKVIYLIHSMAKIDEGFVRQDRLIAQNVSEAIKEAKIKQVIYLGGLGKRDIEQTPHLKSRHEVADILRSSGVPLVELRAAVIIGKGSASFEMIRSLVAHLPIMICPRWVNVKTQPVAIDDVTDYFLEVLNSPLDSNITLDIGGKDILSYRQMMLTVAEIMGLKRLIIPVPVLTPWLSSHWVNLVTSVSAPLARSLIESVRSETICENDDALRMFDIKPKGFSEAVKIALSQEDLKDSKTTMKL